MLLCVFLDASGSETLAAEQPSVRIVPLRKSAMQDTAAVAVDRGQIRLNVSRGQTIRLSQPAKTIFIADPAIADIQAPSNDAAFVFGKKAGRTSFFALGDNQEAIAEYEVIVTQPINDLREMLRSEVGDYAIQVSYTPNGAVLSGTVPNAALAESAKSITAQFLGQGAIITNKLRVAGALPRGCGLEIHLSILTVLLSRPTSS